MLILGNILLHVWILKLKSSTLLMRGGLKPSYSPSSVVDMLRRALLLFLLLIGIDGGWVAEGVDMWLGAVSTAAEAIRTNPHLQRWYGDIAMASSQFWSLYEQHQKEYHNELQRQLNEKYRQDMSANIYPLLAQLNERLWLGHFDLWTEESVPLFRHTLLVRGGPLTPEHVEEVVDIAVSECERAYPAFQFVIWGGKTADEAITAAMFETVGEA